MPQSSSARMLANKKMGEAMHELKEDNMKKGKAKGAGGKARPYKQMVAIGMKKAGLAKKKGY